MTEIEANNGGSGGDFKLNEVQEALASSSTSLRTAQLRVVNEKLSQEGLERAVVNGLLAALFRTHAAYNDRLSRRAVQRCLVTICRKEDGALLAPLVSAIRKESQKSGIAATNAFVLLEWCTILMQQLAGTPLWDKFAEDIILGDADALERCVQPPARLGVAHSALVVARRGVRALVAVNATREKVVNSAVQTLAAKGIQPNAKNSLLLGVFAGVCSRNKDAAPILGNLKAQYTAFYTREIIGAKSTVPSHLANGLHDFFSAFVSLEEFERDFVSPLEKGLLRAPEIILNDLITPLVRALPRDFDLSKVLGARLLKPLLSNIKSSNVAIRNGALTAFRELSSRCSDLAAMGRVAEEILTPLAIGKLPSADHRILHSDMLAVVPKSEVVAMKIAAGVSTVVAKEGNEAALAAEARVLDECVKILARGSNEPPKLVIDTYVKGLADKKPNFRRIWTVVAGESLSSLHSANGGKWVGRSRFEQAVVPPLVAIYDEVIANPLSASQSGLITGALVVCSLAGALTGEAEEDPAFRVLFKRVSVSTQCLAVDPKPSFLLNPRVYSKLNSEEDLRWLYRALFAVFKHLPVGEESDTCLAWAQCLLFLISSTGVAPAVRQEVCEALSRLYVRNPARVARVVVNGVWHWLEAIESGHKESAAVLAKSENKRLHRALHSICLSSKESSGLLGSDLDKALLEPQLCSLLVLARPGLVPRCSWIDLCLRVDVDPASLAQKCERRLLEEIATRTNTAQRVEAVKNAAYDAAAELVFVAPDLMAPRIIQLIQHDLATSGLRELGPVEAAIFRTPEGTAFIDVLAKKASTLPNKNSKDYDTLKWEEEVRAQLAQKKGQPKKLTADETAKVNAQLKKEAVIRDDVGQIEARLLRGVGVIRSLATGPPTDATLWLGSAVEMLLEAIDAGACLVTGDAAPLAFLACSDRVSTRLGTMRPFLGVATLRAHDVTTLPANLMDESFEDLVTRVLYRLRFAGEQRPFDTVSLIYTLPLILLVLRRGGFGSTADDRDAQLVLAVEILSFHTDVCAEEVIPRSELLSTLIYAMQQYSQHYKIVKDCFSDMVRCVAPNIGRDEIGILVQGAIVPQQGVRATVLQAISAEVDMSELEFSEEIWLARHDDSEENTETAQEIWEESEFVVSAQVPAKMLPFLESTDSQLRRAAARSLADASSRHLSTIPVILERLRASYVELAKPRVPQLDEFGMPKKMDLSDPWEARHGIAYAFRELAPSLTKQQLEPFFNFLIEKGPLGDPNAVVRQEMLDAANRTIELHGKGIVNELMGKFEHTLAAPDRNSKVADRVKEAVIIMYGALARHLKPGDAKIPVVIERLLSTLSTPSETVQYAIAECLPPLVLTSDDESSKYVNQILEALLKSKKYAEQRGAAYGLAGLVSGRGITALKDLRVMASLKGALENKKEASQRESALLAYELLSTILGRLFEPYVIQIVPNLLAGFGDSSADVREAALAAAKACFGKLSSFGVKKILPTLLDGLDDQQWRSKKGACDLLGAMAYLDPQQLSQSLPDIIPPLTGVLTDSHKEVRTAANKSLKRFGEVINNPEVKSLVDILLKALSDPTKYTDEALDSLIGVQFVHYLDAPSLALVSRILQRGLGDRSNTKRKAAQVIGSLAHLTEKKDLVSHLPVLVAGLKLAVVDPVPTTRATASRALGSLVEKLGEDALPDLIPQLMQTLKSDTGAGDRLGSAQALSEVLAGLGTTRLEETLPTILQNVESAKPAIREGFMSLFIFLPVCFGNSFANYLGKIIPPILAGLADDIESIRETALRAGRLLVKNFATRAVDLLLPELERGLADDSWRIRLSSVELVGDLLFNLSGISIKDDDDDDDDEPEEPTKEAGTSLREVLGDEKRNKILSALYICRCDTAGAVRSEAITVWKALVSTPRTLKELVPTLSQLIIRRLGSSNMEHKVIASNALGELIRKAGDNILSSLLPTLEEGLRTSSDTDGKQGICLALKELISSASSEALEDHERILISVVRKALTDSDDSVREAAAEAFDSLQQILGKRAVDQVLPFLLNLLGSEEEADNALSALLTLLTETTRSNIILPNLIPTLTAPPISAFNAKALASLAKVAGPAMNRRLPNIVNSLMDNMIAAADDELREDLRNSLDTVIQSIDEFDGLNAVMNVLLQLTRHEDHRKRAATCDHMAKFFAAADVDYSRYNQDVIRVLLTSFGDSDMDVVKAAWSALSEFTKRLKKEDMEALVLSTRQTLLHVGTAGVNLPGFELPKGISVILPIFLQGLMNGTAEQRTSAALAISDLVDRTSESSLKPFVVQITGPLIRVVSERSTEVKSAILLTLNNLLEKMPAALKPFLPQLQRTFAKSLADPSSDLLRSRAAKALGSLIKFTPRVDPLISELVTGSKTTDPGVKTAMLKALFEVISQAGANMGEASRTAVLGLIDMDAHERDDDMTITNAKLLGALIRNVPHHVANNLLKARVVTTNFSNASILALNAVLVESPDVLLDSPVAGDLPGLLSQGMSHKNVFIAENAVLATGKFLLTDRHKSFEETKPIFETLAQVIPPGQPTDLRRLALVLVRTLSRVHTEMVRPHLPILAPPVFASVRDVVIPVKLAAEAAFVALFSIADEESKVFDKYTAGPGADLPANTKRAMGDYFKRVALKLGVQVRERRDAEGGAGGLGLSNDEADDEKEIWSVGKLDVGADVFDKDL